MCEWIFRAKELVEALTITLLLLNLPLFLMPAAHERSRELHEAVERGIKAADIISPTLLLLLLLAVHLLLQNKNRFWRNALGKPDYAMIRLWLAGEVISDAQLRPKVAFAKLEDTEWIAQVNHAAFKNSIFGMDGDLVLERNRAFISRNRRTFLLFYDPIKRHKRGEERIPVGYSCLIPLNSEGHSLYIDGRLRDSDIKPSLLARPGEKPSAVLLFAAVLSPHFDLPRGGLAGEYGPYFAKCLRTHFERLSLSPDMHIDYPVVYAQAERLSTRRLLVFIGFRKTRFRSGNGFRLFALEAPFRKSYSDLNLGRVSQALRAVVDVIWG